MGEQELLQKGLHHHKAGRLKDASTAYQQALAINPENPATLHLLGQIAATTGAHDQAAKLFQKSLSLNPEQYEIWIKLGNTYNHLRNFQESRRTFQKAIETSPDRAEAYLHLGHGLLLTGEKEEAIQNLETAFRKNENSGTAFLLLSQNRTLKAGDPLVKLALEKASQSSLTPEIRAEFHFGLAYAFEKQKKKDLFFKHLREGNQLKRGLSPPWRENFIRNLEGIKKAFTPETFRKDVSEKNRIFTPIFIVGVPRCGSSLTEQVISSHPKVFGADEMTVLSQQIFPRIAQKSGKPFLDGINEISPDDLTEMSLLYQKAMSKVGENNPFITDKFLGNFQSIGLIRLLFPWAKVVHVHRDPLDNCFSIYKNYFQHNLPFCHDFEDMAVYYTQYRTLMNFWNNLIPGFILNIQYEELVKNLEKSSREIIDFCGLTWDEACAKPHENPRQVVTLSHTQARQPVYTKSIGQSRKFKTELKPLIESLAKEGLEI